MPACIRIPPRVLHFSAIHSKRLNAALVRDSDMCLLCTSVNSLWSLIGTRSDHEAQQSAIVGDRKLSFEMGDHIRARIVKVSDTVLHYFEV